jgi:phage nucleotide-binding protein
MAFINQTATQNLPKPITLLTNVIQNHFKKMTIRKKSDPALIQGIIMLIYGEPCVGKTTISFTTEKPLIINFDGNGIYRASDDIDPIYVTPENWKDFIDSIDDVLKGDYKTLVIDTVGGMYELALTSMGKAKMMIQDYGTLNSMLYPAIATLKAKGVNILFIAHHKLEGEKTKRYVPDIGGQVQSKIMQMSDLVGYIQYDENERKNVLNFTKSATYFSKDCADIGNVAVPHILNSPTFLADIIEKTKARISGKSALIATLNSFSDICNGCLNADELNAALAIYAGYGLKTESEKAPFQSLIFKVRDRLKLKFNKETNFYA